ncbi:MAG: hypothetical protein GY776_22835, partial [Alteromonas sp.]|nr:hypothetical protein [Alteromonas sp.]
TSKDQNWNDGSTTYWFNVNGECGAFGIDFDNETYGIAESGGESKLLDCDGCPMNEGDGESIAVIGLLVVTDEMREC